MARFGILLSLITAIAASLFAQTPTTSQISTSDPQAITIATKSLLAMTGGVSVNDATLNASVTWIAGSDHESGTGTFTAKGINESRIDLNLDNETRSEVRTSQGSPSGQWKKGEGKITAASQHNCWTDAAWFFPPLSSLAQVANPHFVFSYLGPETHNGLSTIHLRVVQIIAGDTAKLDLSHLTTTDFYLDSISFLPLAETFNVHPDSDMKTDIPSEIRFANYRVINGVQVPFRIQQLLNGSLLMDLTITNVNINSGVTGAQFILQ